MKVNVFHNPARRDALIRRAVQVTIERRAGGEVLSDEQVCESHRDLMPELGKELLLLRLIQNAGRQSSAGSFRKVADLAAADPDLPRFPGYRTVRATGRGGQGLVYEAIQDRTLRRVAIKLMRDTAMGLTAGASPRFDREARVLAQLDHPNIVGILESGVAAGHAYLVMEYIEGFVLDEYIAERRPPMRDRVLLMERVCLAVHAAHLRGVIHRDLKPSNVLVEADGTPRVLDFGLAAITEAFNGGATIAPKMTQTGQFVGSLHWASPEQARGDASIPDVRSDVYSLGLLLYIALTGAMPYPVDGSVETTIRTITAAQPTRPSTLCAGLDADLDTIVLKCLRKSADDRYQGAGEIAADLKAHLEGRPISARTPSLVRQLRWFVRRNRPLMIGMAAVLGALVFGLATTAWQLRRATKAEVEANTQRDAAEFQAYASGIALAQGAVESPELCGDAIKALNRSPEPFRGWEWHYLMARADQSVRIIDPLENVHIATVSADGTRFLRSLESNELIMVDTRSDSVLWRRPGDPNIANLMLSPHGDRGLCSIAPSSVCLFDGRDGREINRWNFGEGKWETFAMVVGTQSGAVFIAPHPRPGIVSEPCQLRRYAENEHQAAFIVDLPSNVGWPCRLEISPDESTVYLAWGSNTVSAYNARTGAEVRSWNVPTPHDGQWATIAINLDGTLAAVSTNNEINVFGLPDGRLLRTFRGHAQVIDTVAFNPAGTAVVSGSMDQTIRVWSLSSDGPTVILAGHSGKTNAWFTSDGAHLISSSVDRSCRLWDTRSKSPVESFEIHGRVRGTYAGPVVFALDSMRVWGFCDTTAASIDVSTRVLETASCPWASTHRGHLAMDPNRRRVYWREPNIDSEGRFHLCAWNLDTRELIWTADQPADRCALAVLSPEGDQVAFQSGPHSMRICNASTGQMLFEISTPPERSCTAAFLRDHKGLITCTREGSLALWNQVSGEKLTDLPRGGDTITALALSPDESTLAAAFGDRGTIGLWNLRTRTRLADMGTNGNYVHALAFSPDGTRLASGGEDRVIRIWHVHRRVELLRLRGHTDEVNALAWSPDGRSLASVGRDDRLMLWDSAPVSDRAGPLETQSDAGVAGSAP